MKKTIKRIIIITVAINVIIFLGVAGKITIQKTKEEFAKHSGEFSKNFPKIPTSGNFSLFPSGEPACSSDYYAQLIYARPKDVASRFKEVAPKLRSYFKNADGIVSEEAKRFKISAHLKVLCEKQEISVVEANLPNNSAYYLNASSGTRDALIADMKGLGFNKKNAKYIVSFDGQGAGCSKAGSLEGCIAQQSLKGPDDRLTVDNVYNSGPDYVFLYKATDADVQKLVGGGFAPTYDMMGPILILHEYAHTMGAVQPSAPHATVKEETDGQKHCRDSQTIGQGGTDIMCKSDGQGEVFGNECPGFYPFRFDCNNDDYFNPKPEPGSYLATHWNLGSPLNRFITFGK